jgi:membrane protease YdiL (CAAX protease family)
MFFLLKKELLAIFDFARRNRNEIRVLFLVTLFLILARYHSLEPKWLSYLLYYLTLPIVSIVIVLRKNPLDFGLRFGNIRVWGIHVAIACSVSLILVLVSSRVTTVNNYYTVRDLDILPYVLKTAVLLFALEFLYRGFILFGLKEKFGEGAILIQMIPFALLHIGKPEIETIGCIVSGTYFGYLAYRSGSCLPVFIIHLFANVANKMINTGPGGV